MHEPVTIRKSLSVYNVIQKLLRYNISRLLVVDDTENIIGIVSEKDAGLALLSEITDRKSDKIPSSEIMKPVLSVVESLKVRECVKCWWTRIFFI